MYTTLFRRQHTKIREMLNSLRPSDFSAAKAYATLVKLNATIIVHLRMEDDVLYPTLLKSADADVREKTARFQAEMAQLSREFVAFCARWMKVGALGENPRVFQREWHEMVLALRERLNREDDDLYAEFDRLRAA